MFDELIPELWKLILPLQLLSAEELELQSDKEFCVGEDDCK
jgi:hypothetical protein